MRASGAELAVLALFALWSIAPVVALLVHARAVHGSFAGAFSALSARDQFRYLTWIRDAGGHVLISNRLGATASDHVYLHPMFALSGLAWRLGVSLQLSYLAWFPAALAAVGAGFWRYARRMSDGAAPAAVLALALLFLTPLSPLLDYSTIVDANGANNLIAEAGPLAPYWEMWGYLPTAVVIGLMPLYLLGVERILGEPAGTPPSTRSTSLTAGAGLLAAWLSPWSGLTLLLITAVVVLRQRRARALARPAAALALPLLYYFVLARATPAWSLSAIQSLPLPQHQWAVTVAVLAPSAVLAALGVRGRSGDPQELMLRVWPLAAFAAFLLLPADERLLSLAGITLPLAVLGVRGWSRLHPRRWLSAAVLFAATVPGLFYAAHTFRDYVHNRNAPYTLRRPELQALAFVRRHPALRVLGTPYLGTSFPALLGARLSEGYDSLGRNLVVDAGEGQALFGGHLDPTQIQMALQRARAATLVSDCEPRRPDLSAPLAPLGYTRRVDGCAPVYQRGSP